MRFSFDPLEPRRHLSASLDTGGLPRQLTQVGDTIYYALDSGRDGRLSYTDLVAYSPKTGGRTSILRGDGEHFGKYQFTLAEAAGHLLITEDRAELKHGVPVDGEIAWILEPGQTEARRLTSDALVGAPTNFTHLGHRTYFTAMVTPPNYVATDWNLILPNSGRTETLRYIEDGSTSPSSGGIDVNTMISGGDVKQLIAFQDKLAILVNESFTLGVISGHLFFSDGTATHEQHFDSDARVVDKIGIAGGRLAVSTHFEDGYSQILDFQSTSSKPEEFLAVKGVTEEHIVGFVSGKAFISYKTTPVDQQQYSDTYAYTGMTYKTTTLLRNDAIRSRSISDIRDGSAFFRIGDSLYAAVDSLTGTDIHDYDPESVGGYHAGVKPDGKVRTAGKSSESPGPENGYVVRFDLDNAGRENVVLAGPSIYVQRFAAVGSRLFFQNVPSPNEGGDVLSGHPGAEDLYQSDGSRSGTSRVGGAFGGLFVVNGKVISNAAFDSSLLESRDATESEIVGQVVRDDQYAAFYTDDSVGMAGETVFLDGNRDGRREKSEPAATTDANGIYRFANLKSRTYTVAVISPTGWSPTRGPKSVTIHSGTIKAVNFGFADPKHDARIVGTYEVAGFPAGGHLLVLCRTDGFPPDQPLKISTTRTDGDGTFGFSHLAAGSYDVREENGDIVEDRNADYLVPFSLARSARKRLALSSF